MTPLYNETPTYQVLVEKENRDTDSNEDLGARLGSEDLKTDLFAC